MKIKYVFRQTIVGWNWHPVIDDQVLFYPHGTLAGVRQFVNAHLSDIQEAKSLTVTLKNGRVKIKQTASASHLKTDAPTSQAQSTLCSTMTKP